jgi:anti-anti-sigma regulatory factor
MTVRIERETRRLKTMIRVSGRLQSRHLDELKTQLAATQSRIVLDLNGVTLVDVETVRFLNECEQEGIEFLHCWPYIREWMIREKGKEGVL